MLKKYILSFLIILTPYLSLTCKDKKTDTGFMNLNFFEIIDGKPTHWVFVNNGSKVEYTLGHIDIVDSIGLQNQFGMALNQIPIELVRGKTVRISTLIQSPDFNKNIKAGLWCGVDNPNGPSNSAEWTKEIKLASFMHEQHFIEFKVDSAANTFYWGIMAEGKGKIGFGYFTISIDGIKYDDTQSKELSQKQRQWLKNNIYPLATTDPTTTDDKDLKIIADMVDNSKVVALGEITHGAKEVFDMKHRIIRYLAQNNGYDVFSIEDNMPECLVINRDYLIEGKGTAKDYINNYLMLPWRIKEVESMLEWMKDYKEKGGKMQFTGFDKQIYFGIFRILTNTFANNPYYSSQLDSIKTMINGFMQTTMMNGFKPDIEQRNNVLASINELSQTIKDDNCENQDFLQVNLKILKQSLFIEERDNYMADNFLDIMDQNPKSKFIIWAHNLHIRNSEKQMGEYLTDSLRTNYIKVGFVTAEGEYTAWNNGRLETCKVQPAFLGTLDYYLNSIDEPLFVMDLRKIRADKSKEAEWMKGYLLERQTGMGFIDNEFMPFDVNEYDILIFIKKVSASELLNNNK